MMNWTDKVIEECRSAWFEYTEYVHAESGVKLWRNDEQPLRWHRQFVYDFLDDRGIYITIWFEHSDDLESEEYTWSYEIDFKDLYPTYSPYDRGRMCSFNTKTRAESEAAAIKKAFGILEKRIHENEGAKKGKMGCGDTVIHIVLHKIMTVNDIMGRLVQCDWFEGDEFKRATFVADELTICPESQRQNAINAL